MSNSFIRTVAPHGDVLQDDGSRRNLDGDIFSSANDKKDGRVMGMSSNENDVGIHNTLSVIIGGVRVTDDETVDVCGVNFFGVGVP